MSDYWPKHGDRVRVVLEGEAEYLSAEGFEVGGNYIVPSKDHVVSVEKIEPPVEVFKPGDVVRSWATGRLYAISRGGYVNLASGEQHMFRHFDFTSEDYAKVDLSSVR